MSKTTEQLRPAEELSIDDINRLDHAQIESRLPQQHPVAYYLYAQRLMQEGCRDQAVFWGYVGQLRYRFHLQTLPAASNGQALAYFASLQESIGQTLNRAIGTESERWWEILGDVLAWDSRHVNDYTRKDAHFAAWSQTVAGLESFRAQLQLQARSVSEMAANPDLSCGAQNCDCSTTAHPARLPGKAAWPFFNKRGFH